MRSLRSLSIANLRSFLRDRAALFWTLAFPIVFVILFGTILHFAWLLVPAFDDHAPVVMNSGISFVVLTLTLLLVGSALYGRFAASGETAHAE